MALSLIEHEDLDKLPDGELSSSTEHSFYPASLVQVLRVTHQAKCNLIKVKTPVTSCCIVTVKNLVNDWFPDVFEMNTKLCCNSYALILKIRLSKKTFLNKARLKVVLHIYIDI